MSIAEQIPEKGIQLLSNAGNYCIVSIRNGFCSADTVNVPLSVKDSIKASLHLHRHLLRSQSNHQKRKEYSLSTLTFRDSTRPR